MTPPPKRTGLGRGLASLIPTGPSDDKGSMGPAMGAAAADVMYGGAPTAPTAPAVEPVGDVGAVYREIDPAAIEPNPKQPRQVFDGEALAELVHSIREFGLMQPIVVRALDPVEGSPRYQLVMGRGAGARPKRRAWPRSPRSFVRLRTTACCATPCWRTSIGLS